MVSTDIAWKNSTQLFLLQTFLSAMSSLPSVTRTEILCPKNATTTRPPPSVTHTEILCLKNATRTRPSPSVTLTGLMGPKYATTKKRPSPSVTLSTGLIRPKNATTTGLSSSARLVAGPAGSIDTWHEDSEGGFVLKYAPFNILVHTVLFIYLFIFEGGVFGLFTPYTAIVFLSIPFMFLYFVAADGLYLQNA